MRRLFPLLWLAVFSIFGGEEDYEKVFSHHVKILSYLDESHPNLLIVFSGTPAMGKTTIAQKLQNQLHAVRLSSDEVRSILSQLGNWPPDFSVDAYLDWALRKLEMERKNHLFILDRSIDRTFKRYQSFAVEKGYPLFIIKMVVDRKEVERRVCVRGTDVANLMAQIDRCWRHYERFNELHQADFIFDNNGSSEKNLQELIAKIEQVSKAPSGRKD